MTHTGEHTPMEKILAFISFSYTGMTAILTSAGDFEVYTRIFMYISAGILSLISAYYVYKNKGKKK